jgi:hypothetical protein
MSHMGKSLTQLSVMKVLTNLCPLEITLKVQAGKRAEAHHTSITWPSDRLTLRPRIRLCNTKDIVKITMVQIEEMQENTHSLAPNTPTEIKVPPMIIERKK